MRFAQDVAQPLEIRRLDVSLSAESGDWNRLDRHASQDTREISQEWRGDDLAFEDHIRAAIESARRAIETARTAEFLDNIDATISSRLLRHALFSAAREVAGANEAVSPAEGTIIAEVALRFS